MNEEYSMQSSSEDETISSDLRLCRGSVTAFMDTNHVIWYSSVYAIPIISLVGIVSNVVNFTVLWKSGKRLPSHTYLLALAVCDCLFLAFATLEVTPVMLDSFVSDPTFNKIYTHSVLYIRFISSTCFKVSVMLVVGFNVERYICVCQPMRSRTYCNKRNARRAIYLFVFVSVTLSVHWPLVHEKDKCYDASKNSTFYMIRLPENPMLRVYNQIMNYVSMIFFNIVPICTLFALNAMLLVTLRRVVCRDTNSASSDIIRRKSRSANAILFAVVLMFLVCNGPQVPARILFEKFGPYDNLVNVYVAVSQQLIFMNASLNFCLYCLVSKRYRKLLRKTFPCFRQLATIDDDLLAWIGRRKSDLVRKVIPRRSDHLALTPAAAMLELKLDGASQGSKPIMQFETDSN